MWKHQVLMTTLVAVLAVFASATDPVLADQLRQWDFTYWTPDSHCTYGEAVVDHGSGGGYFRSLTQSKVALVSQWGTTPCGDWLLRSWGNIRAKYEAWKYNDATGTWQICAWSDWQYNGSTTHQVEASWNFGASPPCGAGWYGNNAGGEVNVNGQWYGGWVWAQSHYLPS